MGGSSKGGGGKGGGGGGATAAPAVSQPPVSSGPLQNLSAVESQFVNAPWSEPGWQSNVNPIAQGYQSQYLSADSTASEQTNNSGDLSQWLFGGSTTGG